MFENILFAKKRVEHRSYLLLKPKSYIVWSCEPIENWKKAESAFSKVQKIILFWRFFIVFVHQDENSS